MGGLCFALDLCPWPKRHGAADAVQMGNKHHQGLVVFVTEVLPRVPPGVTIVFRGISFPLHYGATRATLSLSSSSFNRGALNV